MLRASKEEESKDVGQFRTNSLLNVDGKVYFGIMATRVMKFVQANCYIDEKHVSSLARPCKCIRICPAQDVKDGNGTLWIPEEIQRLIMTYYDNFVMRFTVGDFTTEWQRFIDN